MRRLSDEQREKLAGSRENLLSAAKCIDELLGIRHMGVKSAEEVARVMRRYGAPITEN